MLQGYCCYSSTPPLIVESIIKGRRNKGLAIIIANWHNDCVFYRYGSISSDILNEAIMDKFSGDKVGCFQPLWDAHVGNHIRNYGDPRPVQGR